MSRSAEAVLVLVTAGLAVLGVLLVNFAEDAYLDRRTALTLLLFVTVFGGLLAVVHRWASGAVPYLIPLAATLTAVGFVMIYRLDHDLAGRQGWWILLGGCSAALILFLLRERGVSFLKPYRWVFLTGALLLPALGAMLPRAAPSYGDLPGSPAWRPVEATLPLGEIASLLLVIFLASYAADRHVSLAAGGLTVGRIRLPDLRGLIPIGLALIAALGVLVYRNDLGASLLVFGLFPIMFYMAANRPAYLAVGFGAYALGLAGATLAASSLRSLWDAWIRPWGESAEAGLRIVQGLFALGAGSISGAGLGLGEPYLVPDAATSGLPAAVAEELGLAGSIAVLAAYVLLVATGFGVALRARDLFHKLLAAGLSLLVGLQTWLLLAGLVRLLPPGAAGVPFMSYGATATIAAFAFLALLIRISHEEGA